MKIRTLVSAVGVALALAGAVAVVAAPTPAASVAQLGGSRWT